MKSIQVRLVDPSGNSVPDKEVSIWKSGFAGGKWDSKRTDRSGSVEFMLDLKDSDRIDVHVAGTSMAKDQKPQADFRFVVG